MKSRDSALRAKRFDADEKGRKAADLDLMIRDFENMAGDLDRQISTEEERTGVRDKLHFAYSTFAKAAAQRRDNIVNSVLDLRDKLEAARKEHELALAELHRVEAIDSRDGDSRRRKGDRSTAALS